MSQIQLNRKLADVHLSGIATVIKQANALGDEVIRMEVGDVDSEMSPLVGEGMNYAVKLKKTHYPAMNGEMDLISQILLVLKQENIHATENQVLVTPGGSMGMYLTFQSLLDPDDEVLVLEPIWPHLIQMIKLAGAVPVSIPLDSTTDFHIGETNIEQYITSKTKAILINSPNNPTGIVYTENEIRQLCIIADKYNLLIISDEEYCNFVFGKNKFCSPAQFYKNTIISRSFSKTYAAAGLRLGYVVGPTDFINTMSKLSLFSSMYPSSIAQYAVTYALINNDPYPNQLCNKFEQRMYSVVNQINTIPGISCKVSEGSVYVWIKFDSKNDLEICKDILYKAKVALVPGSCFGQTGEGFARLSLGQEQEILDLAVCRISELFNPEHTQYL